MLRFAVLVALTTALPAMAADTSAPAPEGDAAATTAAADCPPLYDGLTLDETVQLIRDAGYKAQIAGEPDDPYIESKASGRNFDIYFYNCEGEPKRCVQLMFQIRLSTTKEQQAKALEYDLKKVFGRAYSDDEDTTYLDYALHLNGGVTAAYFTNNLELWDNVVGEFVRYIEW